MNGWATLARTDEFQSSPTPKGECDWKPASPSRSSKMFQSSPTPKGECDKCSASFASAELKFQSSPTPKGECDRGCVRDGRLRYVVSILTHPEG